jgi:hypothetical protein
VFSNLHEKASECRVKCPHKNTNFKTKWERKTTNIRRFPGLNEVGAREDKLSKFKHRQVGTLYTPHHPRLSPPPPPFLQDMSTSRVLADKPSVAGVVAAPLNNALPTSGIAPVDAKIMNVADKENSKSGRVDAAALATAPEAAVVMKAETHEDEDEENADEDYEEEEEEEDEEDEEAMLEAEQVDEDLYEEQQAQEEAFEAEENDPMFDAVTEGDLAAVQALLSAGADVNKGYYPPLYIAAQEGRVDVVTALLAAGASVDPPMNYGAGALTQSFPFSA